jgi:hypothetical protein
VETPDVKSPADELAYWQGKGRYGDETVRSLASVVCGESALEAAGASVVTRVDRARAAFQEAMRQLLFVAQRSRRAVRRHGCLQAKEAITRR